MLELTTNRHPKLLCIANLFEALHENDIHYCHLKGNPQHLKFAFSGESDIDVLFDRKQKAKLESILSALDFKEFKAIKPRQLKDVVDFIALDEGSGKVIHLHTYYAITIGEPYLRGYQVGIPDLILTGRVFNEEFGTYCIAPAFELAFLYMTEILKLRHRDYLCIYLENKIPVSEKTKYQYNWLKRNSTSAEIEAAFRTIFENYASIIDLVKGDLSSTQLRKLAPLVKKGSFRYRLYSPTVALALRWKREVTTRMRRKLSRLLSWPILSKRLNPRGGTVVTVVGAERTGKPEIPNLLMEAFSKKLDVYKVSFQPDSDSTEGKGTSLNNEIKQPPFSRTIKSLILAWKNNLKLKRMQSCRKQGALVICHHFPQNLMIGGKGGTATASQLSPGAEKFAPDLVVKLITGKGTPEPIEAQINSHTSLGKPKVVTVYADGPLDEVVSILKKEIWNIL